MRYEKFVKQVKAKKKILDTIHSFRFWVIGGALIIGGATTTVLAIEGKVTLENVPTQIVYGETIDVSAAATLKDATIVYKRADASEWSLEKPTKVGSYQLKGISSNGFGKETSSEIYDFKIVSKDLLISIKNEPVVYGNLPTYADFSNQLADGDRVTDFYPEFTNLDGTSLNAEVGLNLNALHFYNSLGEDVTYCYKISQQTQNVTIIPRDLSVSFTNATWEYDGLAHTADGVSIDEGYSLVGSDEITFEAGNGFTEIGEYTNAGDIKIFGSDHSDRTIYYNIINSTTGRVEISKRHISVKTPSISKSYDGTSLSKADLAYQITSGTLLEGHHIFEGAYVAEGKYIATTPIENKITLRVLDQDDHDVSDLYDFSYDYGTIQINKVAVSYRTKTISKTYDGSPLQDTDKLEELSAQLQPNDELRINARAKLSNIGETSNTFETQIYNTVLNKDVTVDCYDITSTAGTLILSKRKVQVIMPSYNGVYDGQWHFLDEIKVQPGKDNGGIYDGLSTRDLSEVYKDFGGDDNIMKIFDADDYNLQMEKMNSYNLVIRNSETLEDLSQYYDIEKVWLTSSISQRDLKYKTRDVKHFFNGKGTYDSQAQAIGDIEFEPTYCPQGEDYLKVTNLNEIANVGISENTISFEVYNGSRLVTGNYHVLSETKGTKEIDKPEITIKPIDGQSKVYDGRGYTSDQFQVTTNDGNASNWSIENAEVIAVDSTNKFEATNGQNCELKVQPKTSSGFIVKCNGTKQSDSNYTLKVESSGLRIDKATINVYYGASDQFVYDGKYHLVGNDFVTVAGLVDDSSNTNGFYEENGWIRNARARYQVYSNDNYDFDGIRDVGDTTNNVLGTSVLVRFQYLKEGVNGSQSTDWNDADNSINVSYNGAAPSVIKRSLYLETGSADFPFDNVTHDYQQLEMGSDNSNGLQADEAFTTDSLSQALSSVTFPTVHYVADSQANQFVGSETDFINKLMVQRDKTDSSSETFKATDNYDIYLSYGYLSVSKSLTYIQLATTKTEYEGNILGLKEGTEFEISTSSMSQGAYITKSGDDDFQAENPEGLPYNYTARGTVDGSGDNISLEIFNELGDAVTQISSPVEETIGSNRLITYKYADFNVLVGGRLEYQPIQRKLSITSKTINRRYSSALAIDESRTVGGSLASYTYTDSSHVKSNVTVTDVLCFEYEQSGIKKYEPYSASKTDYKDFVSTSLNYKGYTGTNKIGKPVVLQPKTAGDYLDYTGMTTYTIDGMAGQFIDVTSYYQITVYQGTITLK